MEAQLAFADKLGGIRFPLIADPDGTIARSFDAFKEEWKVSDRQTVVVGEDGLVALAYGQAPADGKGHAEAVYADCAERFA